MRKKWICILLILILCCAFFAACDNQSNEGNSENEEEWYHLDRYNAKKIFHFYRMGVTDSNLGTGLKVSFLNDNSTMGLVIEENGRRIFDKSSPEYKGYIIKDREQMEEIFETLPEVNLETQIIVIVFFTTTSRRRDFWRGFEQEGKTLRLKIKTEYQESNGSWSVTYAQIGWGFVLDKLDVTEIEFVFYQ